MTNVYACVRRSSFFSTHELKVSSNHVLSKVVVEGWWSTFMVIKVPVVNLWWIVFRVGMSRRVGSTYPIFTKTTMCTTIGGATCYRKL